MDKYKLTFNQDELAALNTIFDIALKARGLELIDAIQYLKNKINAEIKDQEEKKQVVDKAIEKTVTKK